MRMKNRGPGHFAKTTVLRKAKVTSERVVSLNLSSRYIRSAEGN